MKTAMDRMRKTQRYSAIVDVHLLLMSNGRILLGQRQNTGFQDRNYHLPAGHLEPDETILEALMREAREELGIKIKPDQARLAMLMHQKSSTGRLGVFFVVQEWEGEIVNAEPDKCSHLKWFDLDNLPDNMVPYAKEAVAQYRHGQ